MQGGVIGLSSDVEMALVRCDTDKVNFEWTTQESRLAPSNRSSIIESRVETSLIASARSATGFTVGWGPISAFRLPPVLP